MASQAATPERSQTLEAALARIQHLELLLKRAQHLVRERTGLELQEMLAEEELVHSAGRTNHAAASAAASNGASPARPSPAARNTTPETTSAPPTVAESAEDSAPEPADVGPYILRALALRKRMHLGEVDEAQAADELRVLFDGEAAALSEEQRASVRQWAGL